MNKKRIYIPIIVIITIAVIGAVYYIIIRSNGLSRDTLAPQGNNHLSINEWRKTLAYPIEMTITYTSITHPDERFTSSSTQSISLELQQLSVLDKVDCRNGAFGILSRSQTLPVDSTGVQLSSSTVVMDHGWFYWFIGSQAPCGTSTQAIQLQSQAEVYFGSHLRDALN